MVAAEGPLLHRRRLGVELRRLRDGRTLDEVADATLISTSKLSRLENGQGVPQPRDIRDLIAYYDVDGATAERLRKWASAGRRQAWWKEYSDVLTQPLDAYLDFESGASTIRAYAATVIPGLLQTREYYQHVLTGVPPAKSPDHVERLLDMRERRQELLHSGAESTRLITVIDEAALRRCIGSSQVMRAQLDQLHALSRLRNISIQILPFSAGAHAGLAGMFTVFQFADDIDRDVVGIEAYSGDRYLEEQSSVLEYLRLFDAITNKALDHDDTRALLISLMSTYSLPKDAQ
jgi:transcriptional regulator with XRE-family HTH domain